MTKSERRDGGDQPLGHTAVTAVMWTAAQRWAVRITGFVTIAVLTRMLTPAEFGTVAIAASLLPMAYLLADMGFSTYIVQATQVDQRMLSTAFWFTSVAGVALAGGLIAAAPLIAAAFDVSDVTSVVYGLAPAVLLVTISTVPMSLLRRRMRFQQLAVQSFVASFFGQLIAIVIALMGYGVWALISQTVINQLVVSVMAWRSASWRPSASFSKTELRGMTSFGVKVVGVEIIATSRGLAENAIITAALGVSGLGYLSIAQRLVQVAQDVSAAALVPVSTVVFAQVRTTAERLRRAYLRTLGLSYAVIVPVMALLALSSPILLPALFGDQWEPSVVPSQVLAIVSIFVLGAMLDHGLFYGTGRPGLWLVYAAAIDVLTIVSALVTAWHGLVIWSLGFLCVAIVATFVRWPLVGRVLETRWYAVAGVFLRSMSTALFTAGIGVYASWISRELNPVVSLVLMGVAIGLGQIGGMSLFMRPELRDGTRLLTSRFAGWRAIRNRGVPANSPSESADVGT